MTPYVALIRAVNVGGSGTLAMDRLKRLCEDLRFLKVKTYLASGNVVFLTDGDEAAVKSRLEAALVADLGSSAKVYVRSATEMARVLAANPFAAAPPARVVAYFLDAAPPGDFLAEVSGLQDERLLAGTREIFVHYPSGQGGSKLRIPAAKAGTARNFNTIANLAALLADL